MNEGSTFQERREQEVKTQRGHALTEKYAASAGKSSAFQLKLGTVVIAIGAVLAILLFIITVLKNIWLMMMMFPLFFVVLGLAFATVVFIRIKGYSLIRGLAAGIVVGVLGFFGAREIYDSGNRYYPSEYCADYIRKLPDGSTPKLTEKRNGRGNEVAALTPGQWVKINGISYKEDQYNITTWDGATGWVEGAAFPKDGAQWLFDRYASDGSMEREVGIDRQVEEYAKKYLTVKGYNGGKPVVGAMTDATLQRAIRLNAQTPLMSLSREDFKEKGDTVFVKTDMTVTLESIVYADECTMLHISVNKGKDWYKYQSLGATFETLVVKDLNTGETYDIMPGNYGGWEDENKRHTVFFFWTFKSRYFSLTHTGYHALERRGGGIIGKIASVVSVGLSIDYFTDWNFPEIRVR